MLAKSKPPAKTTDARSPAIDEYLVRDDRLSDAARRRHTPFVWGTFIVNGGNHEFPALNYKNIVITKLALPAESIQPLSL
jgi:hypothetical protein